MQHCQVRQIFNKYFFCFSCSSLLFSEEVRTKLSMYLTIYCECHQMINMPSRTLPASNNIVTLTPPLLYSALAHVQCQDNLCEIPAGCRLWCCWWCSLNDILILAPRPSDRGEYSAAGQCLPLRDDLLPS